MKLEEKLCEHLVSTATLTEQDLARARQAGEDPATRAPLPLLLVRLGLVSDEDMAEALAAVLDCPRVTTADHPGEPLFGERLSLAFLRDCHALPLAFDGETLQLAMANPLDEFVRRAVAMAAGCRVEVVVATLGEIDAALERIYGSGRSPLDRIVEEGGGDEVPPPQELERLRDMASEAPVVRVVNLLLENALKAGASDIHIEPFEHRLVVRYRIDGRLQAVEAPPGDMASAVVSRIKLIAHIDIAERRRPQDGRIRLRLLGRDIDVRVSTVPTLYGESLVMRLLDSQALNLDYAALGFDAALAERFATLLEAPHGMMLVTGPTGSGKTTTLYAALGRLNAVYRKILTVEDPVEYQLDGINQIQVNTRTGLDFSNALRSIVRQDPDVIMVGELRDTETARMGVQAALTGHLVLSTLHTNDASSTVTRLLDMGLEPYLLASTLNGVLAQRLVRRLCPACRRPVVPDAGLRARLETGAPGQVIEQVWEPVGCGECRGSGYRGRTGIHELLAVDDAVRAAIGHCDDAAAIGQVARAAGMRTLYQDGCRKVAAGITSLQEVLRVTLDTA